MKIHYFPRREKGLTFLGFIMMMVLIGFFANLVLKIGPIYLNHFKVKTSLESLKSEQGVFSQSRSAILNMLQRRWDVDDVEGVSKDDIEITKDGNTMNIQITYDMVKNVMGNVDVLIHFNEAIEVREN